MYNAMNTLVGLVRAKNHSFVYTMDKSTKMIVVVDMTKITGMAGCKKKCSVEEQPIKFLII